ncbi:MAG: hypothetical protein J6T99_00820 [Oscillospiraceae bacterium]|nr:hypothetical protein [Oscillospiraceae bacterium]
MNRVSVGSTYIANWAYSGENSRGKYEMLKVSSEKKNEDITIFVNNVPSGIAKGERFVLNKITDVIVKWRKGQVWNPNTKTREEGWVQEFDINADVTRLSSDLADIDTGVLADEFANIDDLPPWEELPL